MNQLYADCPPQLSPSTMLVLAKKPDEAFKAPLKTKKQAPVTVGEKKDTKREKNNQNYCKSALDKVRKWTRRQPEGGFLQTTSLTRATVEGRDDGSVSGRAPLRGW